MATDRRILHSRARPASAPINSCPILTLQGNPYAMGQQHGQQVRFLRAQIAAAIEARFQQIEQDGPDARFELLLQETCELLQEVGAPLLTMIRGRQKYLSSLSPPCCATTWSATCALTW